MNVKSDTKKINWKKQLKKLLLFSIVPVVAILVYYIVSITIKNKAKRFEYYRIEQEKVIQDKLSKLLENKYDLVCKGLIINSSNYKIIKVKDDYKIVVGEIKNIKESYTFDRCDIIYEIKKGKNGK